MTSNDDAPRIVERAEQACVGIRTRATLGEWSRVNALLPAVFEWLDNRGIGPSI